MFIFRRASALAKQKANAMFPALLTMCSEAGSHILCPIKVLLGAVALLFVGAAAPAQAWTEMIIDGDNGGNVSEYATRAQIYAASKIRIIIRGQCLSACTFYLGNPHTCAEPDAVIKFHAATWTVSIPAIGMVEGQAAPEATRKLVRSYPQRLKNWIARHGGLTQDWLVLEKAELLSIIPACKPSTQIAAAKLRQHPGRLRLSVLALKHH